MKNTIKFIVCILSILFMMAFKSYRAKIVPLVQLKSEPIVKTSTEIILSKVEIDLVSHQQFLNAIGHRESSNNYNVVNRFGYMGKYQFGKRTLRGLGFKISKEEFLNSPEIQEEAMHKLLQTNKRYLKKYIDEYEGQIVHGVLVTESGLLAAAHLGGAGSVKKWFRTGKVRKDGNGVKITTYMERFSGYDLYL